MLTVAQPSDLALEIAKREVGLLDGVTLSTFSWVRMFFYEFETEFPAKSVAAAEVATNLQREIATLIDRAITLRNTYGQSQEWAIGLARESVMVLGSEFVEWAGWQGKVRVFRYEFDAGSSVATNPDECDSPQIVGENLQAEIAGLINRALDQYNNPETL